MYILYPCHIDSHNSTEDVERSLRMMVRNMTATEKKWLIRVLLKDMRLGIGQGTIFNAWHPDAKDYYDVNNNLEKVNGVASYFQFSYEGMFIILAEEILNGLPVDIP